MERTIYQEKKQYVVRLKQKFRLVARWFKTKFKLREKIEKLTKKQWAQDYD